MGNCQAAEAATVIIQHPAGNKVERIYSSVTARHVMTSNPDHFVALVVPPPPPEAAASANGITVKHLKLLRPDDMLLLGQVYRLVSVQDVLKEFAAKKCVKLAKLLERGGVVIDKSNLRSSSSLNMNQNPENRFLAKEEHQQHRQGSSSSSGSSGGGSGGRGMGKIQSSGGHWKPALQSISEFGT